MNEKNVITLSEKQKNAFNSAFSVLWDVRGELAELADRLHKLNTPDTRSAASDAEDLAESIDAAVGLFENTITEISDFVPESPDDDEDEDEDEDGDTEEQDGDGE